MEFFSLTSNPFIIKLMHLSISFLGIGFLILIHELGHWIFCKLFNVSTPTFSIGFGPAIIKKKIWDTTFVIAPIPLGGYVEMAPAKKIQKKEVDDLTILTKKPLPQGILILLGGIIFNLAFAFIVSIYLTTSHKLTNTPLEAFAALPKIKTISGNINELGTPLEQGDFLLAINNESITSGYHAASLLYKQHESPKSIQIERENKIITLEGLQNITPKDLHVKWEMPDYDYYSFKDKISLGIKVALEAISQSIKGIISILTSKSLKNASSVVGMISQGSKALQTGFANFLALLALISIGLAILNLIPIPLLDGGVVVTLVISKIIGRPLPEKMQKAFTYISLGILLSLTVYTIFNDIIKMIF